MFTAADIMTPCPVAIRHDDSLGVAQSIMRLGVAPIRHLPVLKAGKLVGVISDRDIGRTRDWEHTRVEAAMSNVVHVARPRTPLRRAIARMLKHHIGALPVVDSDGLVVGIISIVDVAQCFANLAARIDQLQAGRRRGLTPAEAQRLTEISSMVFASLPARVALARRTGRRSFADRDLS